MDSTRPTQDVANMGGTAPGGITAFMGSAAQWNTRNSKRDINTPPGAVRFMHMGLADEAPDGSGNVPIHPGIRPGLYRTGDDANPHVPDGEARFRGESPEIEKQPKGSYVL
jgi:hypothetical protein